MKLFFSTLFIFLTVSYSFAQKARVLLTYNAFKADKDTLQIGDTLSYGSEKLDELIFLENNAYLALMNENGSLLEWKNKEKGKYKIEFDERDTTFNEARKYIVRGCLLDKMYKNRTDKKNMYLGRKKTGAISCPPLPREIEILAESKSTYLKDSLQIFVEYFKELLKENEEIKSNTLKIEITDLRQNIIYNQELDTNFFLLSWDKIDKEQTIILFKFSVQTTNNREIKSFYNVLQKAKQPLSYQEKYFQSEEKTAMGIFLQFLYIHEDFYLNIYAYQLYHNFLKRLPKEAHSIIPTWEEFKENYGVGYIR